MSALYVMRYLGRTGVGWGTVYVGRGTVLGADVADGRYKGTYVESGGRIKGNVALIIPPGGVLLVTGAQLPAGATVPLTIDWPLDFGNGQAQQVMVPGGQVQVTFEKLGDVP